MNNEYRHINQMISVINQTKYKKNSAEMQLRTVLDINYCSHAGCNNLHLTNQYPIVFTLLKRFPGLDDGSGFSADILPFL